MNYKKTKKYLNLQKNPTSHFHIVRVKNKCIFIGCFNNYNIYIHQVKMIGFSIIYAI